MARPRRGRVRILEDGKLRDEPWFTIGGLSDGNEEGLLGLVFHPDFAKNGRVFVNYTSRDMATHIVEYRATADRVDPKTAHELIRIEQPYSNHNGGNLVFGPDGKLYTGMGDGGKANDPHRNGQNPKALLAKIVRFDVDAAQPAAEPKMEGGGLRPAPEPKMEGGGLRPAPEVVHMGMRNPWRFAFDRDGTLYIGDVGQNLWEEVDVAPAGSRLNFGWNVRWSPDGIRDHWDWKAALDREGVLQQISSFGSDGDGELYLVELTGGIYRLEAR